MKRLLLLVLCMCILLSACSKPQTQNNDTDSLKNSDTSKISDSSPDTFIDTSFRPSDTDYPKVTETDDPSLSNEMSDDIITQLKKDFFKYRDLSSDTTLNDIIIRKYLGTYNNDCIAVYIYVRTLNYPGINTQQDIAGYHFIYPSTETLYIYQDLTFSEIKEAYQNGIISEEDVASIFNDHDLYLTEHFPNLKDMKG